MPKLDPTDYFTLHMRVDCFLWFLRWSAEFGAPRNGSPEIHVMLAEYIYSESPEVVGVTAKFLASMFGF